MTQKKYYITTPLYYVNAQPHIGHAYTNVLCDTFARYHRFRGEKVYFLTGTDEHGTKIEKTARSENAEPRAFVDRMVPQFKELWRQLGITYDQFIRTTDDIHKKAVAHVLADLEKKGEIYKASYTGWYCTPCESFWTKLQLAEGKCPDCHREVQELSEENYFFKLSKYQKWLVDYIEKNPAFIQPEMRRNEILGFLRDPLEDLCITRPRERLSWGIDYPNSKEHVVYVWFDALINYVSAIGYTADEPKFIGLWPADLHMVGKDILRQHAVYWPIMLRACGLPMPVTVLAHGWWTLAGAKVSKSRGNSVDPFELIKKYSVDAFRYFLLREVTIGYDGAFSEDLLAERYRTDLANDLGNLWFRLVAMVGKYFDGKLPQAPEGYLTSPLYLEALGLFRAVDQAMAGNDPRTALSAIWSVLSKANQYVEERKPWAAAKDKKKTDYLAETMVVLAEALAHAAVMIVPFLPETAKKILTRLRLDAVKPWPAFEAFEKPLVQAGTVLERGEALFPRLDEPEGERKGTARRAPTL